MNPLANRIITIFCSNTPDNHVNFRQFIQTLSPLSPVSSREEKLRFVFKIYDVDNDGFISTKDLNQVLKMLVGENLDEQQLNTISNKTILEGDKDGDDQLSFEEFCETFSNFDVINKMGIKSKN
jgi:Ca2+-binding EF-hand superfamily protein